MTAIPPQFPNKAVQKVADELRRLEGERDKAGNERVKAERARGAAVDADRQAHAGAIRAGKSGDPGAPATDKADAAIAKARRREQALATAVGQAREEFRAAVHGHRGELEAAAEERVAEARERYARALEALVDAHRELGEANGFAAWLADLERGYAPAKHTPAVRGLKGMSGDAPPFEQVAAALAVVAEPLRPIAAAGVPRPDREAA